MQKLKLMEVITRKFIAANAEHNDVDEVLTWFNRNIHANDLEEKQQAYRCLHALSDFLQQYETKYKIDFAEINELVETLRDYSLQEEYKALPATIDKRTVEVFSMLALKNENSIKDIQHRERDVKKKFCFEVHYKLCTKVLTEVFFIMLEAEGVGKYHGKLFEKRSRN